MSFSSPVHTFNSYALILSSFLILGCSSNKAPQVSGDTLGAKKTDTAASRDKSFETFFKKFQSDSVFQVSRVSFPLKVEAKDDEGDSTKFINEAAWVYTSIISGKAEKGIIKKKKISAKEYTIQCQVEDTGLELDYHFVYNNGEWRLSLVEDYSD